MSAVPPPGGDVNKGPAILAIVWTLTILGIIVVGARLYGRLKLTRNPGRDDVMIVISIFLTLFYSCLCTAAVVAGGGRHPYYLGKAKTSQATKLTITAFVPGIVSIAVPKLAVVELLLRLLNPSKFQRWFLYGIAIFGIIVFILDAAFLLGQCTPLQALWTPALVPQLKCWNSQVLIDFSIFVGAYSAFVDFYLAAYPVVVLQALNLNQKKKIGLCFILGFGSVSGIIAIYKCTRLYELLDQADFTFAVFDLFVLCSVEPNVIIIAACIPTLRPLFLLAAGRSINSSDRSGSSKQNGNSYELFSDSRKKKSTGPREVYPTDTIDLVGKESQENILPPNGIRKTTDVNVDKSRVIEEGRSSHQVQTASGQWN